MLEAGMENVLKLYGEHRMLESLGFRVDCVLIPEEFTPNVAASLLYVRGGHLLW